MSLVPFLSTTFHAGDVSDNEPEGGKSQTTADTNMDQLTSC